MENLEQRCLEKLDKILSKFDLKIDIVHIASLNVCQYRLVDKSLSKTDWLGLWLSLDGLLFNNQSIFKCLEFYYNRFSDSQLSILQRYVKTYQFIQPLKSSCLEEFIIKCDLVGI